MKIKYSILIFLFSQSLFAQEICNNGIDDDGDQAIDLQDPECNCALFEGTLSEDFENFTDCPLSVGAYLDLISEWRPAGTPQLVNTCGYTGGQFNLPFAPLPFPSGEGAVGIDIQEGLVRCMDNCPLLIGEDYTLSFSAAHFPENPGEATTLILYGRNSCADLDDGPADYDFQFQNPCLSTFDWIEIASIPLTGTEANWNDYLVNFTADSNYGSILLGYDCESTAYTYIDLLDIDGTFSGNACLGGPAIVDMNTELEGDCLSGTVFELDLNTAEQYQWYRNGVAIAGATDNSLSMLPLLPGYYQARATFADGSCTVSDSIIIDSAFLDVIDVELTATDPLCAAGNTGSIFTSVLNSSNQPFSYEWSNMSQDFALINLSAGEYTLLLTDANGCIGLSSETLIDPDPIILDFITVNPQCSGDNSGSIEVLTDGLQEPFSFLWSNSGEQSLISNLTAGIYNLNFTDGNGCTVLTDIELEEPDAINLNLEGTNPACAGQASGSIEAITNDLNGVIQYNWNTNDQGAVLNNVPAGDYTLTISYGNDCESIATITLEDPEALTFDFIAEEPNCYQTQDGTLSINTDGLTPPLTYQWTGGSTDPFFTGLKAGTYSLSLTDGNGCQSVNSIVLEQPDSIMIQANIQEPEFFTGGSIDLEVSGGVAPYTFDWANGQTSSSSLSNIGPGVYPVTVSDANGCFHLRLYELTDPLLITAPDELIFVPNIFSPNNDGINDLFRFFVRPEEIVSKVHQMRIVDRWGGVMYEVNEQELSSLVYWDGKYNGKKASPGIYTYFIELELYNGDPYLLQGNVTLIR